MKEQGKDVDAYLAQFPKQQQSTLQQIRTAIKAAVPDVEETISYGVPMYKKQGQLAAFGGFKNHCSFFPTSYAVLQAFAGELDRYTVSKGTIRFPVDQPLPSALVKKMVLAKLKENEGKLAKKKSIKSTNK